MKFHHLLFCGIIFLSIILGCRNREAQLIMPEKLFELSIGKAETDLSYFTQKHISSINNIKIKMRDGLIYILDGNLDKLMEFNSYGEILSLWYDPTKNPQPTLLRENTEENITATKKAFPLSFHNAIDFAVNSQKQIFLVDSLPVEKAPLSPEYGLTLNNQIICFNKEGIAEYILGQEGIAGTPFPYISDINIDKNDCLNISCFTKTGKLFFRYDKKGHLLHKTQIVDHDIPLLRKDTISRQAEFLPSNSSHELLIRCDTYTINTNSNDMLFYSFYKTILWSYDLNENKFKGYFNLPNTETRVSNSSSLSESTYPVMVSTDGFDHRGNSYFSYIEQNDIERLVILNQFSESIETKRIFTGFENMLMIKRFITPEGIVLAMIFKEDKVEVVWWRTDL